MKAALRNFNIIVLLALSAVVLMRQPVLRAGDNADGVYSVETGKIRIYAGDSVRSVAVGGPVDWHCRGDGGVYYVTVKAAGGSGVPHIGFVDLQSGDVKFEKKLPVGLDEYAVRKFMVSEGIAYILAELKLSTGTERILERININSMASDRRKDVLDFHVEGRDLLVLAKSGSDIALTNNEISVPITLPGEGGLRISAIIDGRMAFVTNGDETEIADMRSGRALYRYANNKEFLTPESHNMVIQAVDSRVSEQDDREMIFYKVFVNGTESGRTNSGPANLLREFRIKVNANEYHLVKLERWVLNTAKGRYDRENNIRQPQVERIFIPMNRIVKIMVKFDGKKYHFDVSPLYK